MTRRNTYGVSVPVYLDDTLVHIVGNGREKRGYIAKKRG
jgi:hypothetical protein